MFMLNRKATDTKITLNEDDWEDLKEKPTYPTTNQGDWEVLDVKTEENVALVNTSTVFCYNLMHTKKERSNVKNRGARMKAIAVGSCHQFFDLYKVFLRWNCTLLLSHLFGPRY